MNLMFQDFKLKFLFSVCTLFTFLKIQAFDFSCLACLNSIFILNLYNIFQSLYSFILDVKEIFEDKTWN